MRLMIVAVASMVAGTALAQVSPDATEDVPPGAPSSPGPVTSGRSSAQGSMSLSAADRIFLQDAAAANLAQIKLGQLAISRSSTEPLRTFGRTIVDDHTDANARLEGIATSLGVTLPTAPKPEQKSDYQRLSALSGTTFDREFVAQVRRDQKQAESLFKSEAESGTDSQLKSFAQSTLPSLRSHGWMAKQSLQKM